MAIYPVDSVIQPSNNRDQIKREWLLPSIDLDSLFVDHSVFSDMQAGHPLGHAQYTWKKKHPDGHSISLTRNALVGVVQSLKKLTQD